jgi:hypothetical protein
MKLTREHRSTRGKTCSSATLPTTNPTWTELGSNPGLRGERPATNRLSHGTAFLPSRLSSSPDMLKTLTRTEFTLEETWDIYISY